MGRIIISFLFFLSFNVSLSPTLIHATTKVFIVHSYEKGQVCGQPQHDGVVQALRDAGYVLGRNLDLKVYYMDTKRRNNTPELIRKQAEIVLRLIKEFNPNVLVTLDDNAFRYVGLNLVDTPLPIVFSGMNAQPEDYHKIKQYMESRQRPGHNITGVYEKLHFLDALKVQSRIIPGLKKVIILTEFFSPTGRALARQVALEMEGAKLPCAIEVRVIKSWEQYKHEIEDINKDPYIGAIYPAALLLKDKDGDTYTAPEIFGWMLKHCRKPAMAINYAFVKLGLFGGAVVDFKAMGYQAGRMVVRILGGEDPGDIPIEDAERFVLVFNLARARELGIDIPMDILLAADEVIVSQP